MPRLGEHILLDVEGNLAFSSQTELTKILTGAAKAGGATVLSSHFHPFGDKAGITGVLLLAESHISVHTWPEKNYAAFDVFMCGKCQAEKAIEYICASDPKGIYQIRKLDRGLPSA